MPIYLVKNDVLNVKSECIVCPAKYSKLYIHEGIWWDIFKKAGEDDLLKLYKENNPMSCFTPVITDGFNVSKYIIHIVVSDMILCQETFKNDIYNSYHDIIKLIIKNNIKNVIIPPLEYSYKRVGEKHSFRTCVFFLNYFIMAYHMDCNFFILTTNKVVVDNLNDYKSTYISHSYPLSKRHKAPSYPFESKDLFDKYISSINDKPSKNLIFSENYNLIFNNYRFKDLYLLIKNKYDNDFMFCFKANIDKNEYKRIIETDYIPCKNVMISILLALELDLETINKYLSSYYNEKLDETNYKDDLIIKHILAHDYDVFKINEELFINNIEQLGRNTQYEEVYKIA